MERKKPLLKINQRRRPAQAVPWSYYIGNKAAMEQTGRNLATEGHSAECIAATLGSIAVVPESAWDSPPCGRSIDIRDEALRVSLEDERQRRNIALAEAALS